MPINFVHHFIKQTSFTNLHKLLVKWVSKFRRPSVISTNILLKALLHCKTFQIICQRKLSSCSVHRKLGNRNKIHIQIFLLKRPEILTSNYGYCIRVFYVKKSLSEFKSILFHLVLFWHRI